LLRLAGEWCEAEFVRIETAHPKELGATEIALWRSHQRDNADLLSPYFAPEWAQIVGAARDDARVCIIDGGAGFFAAQRLSRFAAMGIGAPICDYQGVVGAPADAAALCRALKVGRVDLTHVPASQSLLTGSVAGKDGSWIAQTAGGRDLYLAAVKARRSEFLSKTDKKQRKFEREHGRLEFRANVRESSDFETLLNWKNAQLARSGQPEIWATPWVRRVLEDCFNSQSPTFSGALFTLTVDGRPAAGAFFLRAGPVMHAWVIAHDNDFDAYSPGLLLARWAVCWAAENGVAEVDFGPGADSQYKRQLSTTQRPIVWGAAGGATLSKTVRCTAFALRAGIERLPQPRLAALPGKAMRKLDLMRALAA
jgi:CelD/BcsL family acetyltransferase involved in cellulose biosynthesis